MTATPKPASLQFLATFFKMKPSRRQAFKKTLSQYGEATTIHGPQYISTEGRLISERILWIVLVLSALTFAVFLSCNIYKTWQENPILTTVATTSYPIEKLEYPTITICPQGEIRETVGRKRWK